MFHTIVVALDGSAASEAALPYAAAIAHAAGAALELVHVHVPWLPEAGFAEAAAPSLRPPEVPEAGLPHPTAAEKRRWLEELARRVAERTGVAASAGLLEGPLVPTLRHHIEESGAELLVMTTRGQRAGGPTWLGSVAQSFARGASVPLLLVPLPPGEPEPWREPRVRRILVALDGSPPSERVLGPAQDVAAAFRARLRLLLVLPPESDAAERQAAESYLAATAAKLADTAGAPELEVAVHEQPATAILEEVRRHSMDLVAVASHGESGISRMLLGGPAQEMLRGAEVPLLLVRATGAEPGEMRGGGT